MRIWNGCSKRSSKGARHPMAKVNESATGLPGPHTQRLLAFAKRNLFDPGVDAFFGEGCPLIQAGVEVLQCAAPAQKAVLKEGVENLLSKASRVCAIYEDPQVQPQG